MFDSWKDVRKCHAMLFLEEYREAQQEKEERSGQLYPKKKGMRKLLDCHSFFTKHRADAPTCTGTTTSHQPHWLTSLTKPIVVTWEMQRNALTKQKLEWFPHKKHLMCIVLKGNCHRAEALRFTKLTNVLIYQIEHARSFPKLKESLLPTHASSSER